MLSDSNSSVSVAPPITRVRPSRQLPLTRLSERPRPFLTPRKLRKPQPCLKNLKTRVSHRPRRETKTQSSTHHGHAHPRLSLSATMSAYFRQTLQSCGVTQPIPLMRPWAFVRHHAQQRSPDRGPRAQPPSRSLPVQSSNGPRGQRIQPPEPGSARDKPWDS
jgi:hypothetical protein